MGVYIEPQAGSKEKWLEKHGREFSTSKGAQESCKQGDWIIVYIDSPPVTVALVAYCQSELKEFTNPTDIRPKRYFVVSQENLEGVLTRADMEWLLDHEGE